MVPQQAVIKDNDSEQEEEYHPTNEVVKMLKHHFNKRKRELTKETFDVRVRTQTRDQLMYKRFFAERVSSCVSTHPLQSRLWTTYCSRSDESVAFA